MMSYEYPKLTTESASEVCRYLFRLVEQMNQNEMQRQKEIDELKAKIAYLRKDGK